MRSGSAAERTRSRPAAMLSALAPIVEDVRPDAVLVYGDTNSTLAGALVAAKLGVPVAHVEAGLRSFDRRMPEEVNRVVADHLSRWLFVPTQVAIDNLAAEGIVDGVELVGDLMQDLAARIAPLVRDPAALQAVPLRGMDLAPGRYLFATIHRAENRIAGGDPGVGRTPQSGRQAGPARRPRAPSRDPSGARDIGHRPRETTSSSSNHSATGHL